ncbi:hypothetical protein CASFOL_042747 [Castilleja foliolosa]|uniref:Uncharacterized protein n=1 Tax=Castilleja foliolosa TaxID=1961234 RepID=A0ABD3B879_9LAMI
MTVLSTKHIVLVTLLLLCFFSTSSQGRRSLSMKISQQPNEKGKMVVVKKELIENEDLGAMDYTPARKRTPIHN